MLEAVILLAFGALLVFAIQETQNRQINETLRLSASQLNAVVDIRAGQYVIQDADKAALMAQGISGLGLDARRRHRQFHR